MFRKFSGNATGKLISMSTGIMRNIFCIAALLVIFSCSKEKVNSPSDLNGSWRLVEVYDKTTNETSHPPTDNDNNLTLQFSQNTFSGNTLRNSISDGSFTIPGNNQIVFDIYSMTEVNEEEFGTAMLTVLSSCFLSSYYPCKPCDFTVNRGKLEIESPLRYKLTFEKL